jgi:aminoacylase
MASKKSSTQASPMAAAAASLLLGLLLVLPVPAVSSSDAEEAVVSRFREYLRIDTAQPAPDYAAAVAFLRGQAGAAGLEARTLELVAGKPLLLLRWPGRRPSLPSLLLNSHTDVVPSEPHKWDHPPFSAALDEASGRIYARGSQARFDFLSPRLLKISIFGCLVNSSYVVSMFLVII